MARKNNQYTNPFLNPNKQVKGKGTHEIEKLQKAIAFHQQGNLANAEIIYREILSTDSRNADALHLLGVIAHQTGNQLKAIELIGKALEINSKVAVYFCNLGNAQQQLGLIEDAISSFKKAILINKDYSNAYFNLANLLKKNGQVHDALACYEKVIPLSPNDPGAYVNRGVVLQELGQLEEAINDYNKAIALDANLHEAYSNKGIALNKLNQHDQALVHFKKAISLKPNHAASYLNRGVVYLGKNNFLEAVHNFEKAIALNPKYSEAFSNLSIALGKLSKFEQALMMVQHAIELDSNLVSFHFNKASLLHQMNRFEEALLSYQKLLTLAPNYEFVLGYLQEERMYLCYWHEYDQHVAELSQRILNNEKSSTPFCAHAFSDSPVVQLKAAKTWSDEKFPLNNALGPIIRSTAQGKIRIGYFSADFHWHPVSILMAGLFEHHDKSKFELIAFSIGPETSDEMRGRIKNAFDRFIDIALMGDQEVAELSRSLGIDIAVDLGGHTRNSRTGIFAYRAAPIQLSYIGYLGTMGAKYYDYLIADQTLIPRTHQHFYSEKIVYLPSYQVNDNKQVIPSSSMSRKDFNLPENEFVFCCFNSNYKITPSIFNSWMRILTAVPESVLLLYTNVDKAKENLKLEAEKRGVNPDRVIFGGRLDRKEYLERCKSADLFLDTLPYNAGATASDALWAGLPVLTCMGETFASRYAASLLHSIGLSELITHSQNEYETLAIELAKNSNKLAYIKNKLVQNQFTSSLFDTARFAKFIEEAYIQMFERHQANLQPDHIYIV